MYIIYGTPEWDALVSYLSNSVKKTNRDHFCLTCWAIMSYELCNIHKREASDHVFTTSKDFCNVEKFLNLAATAQKTLNING